MMSLFLCIVIVSGIIILSTSDTYCNSAFQCVNQSLGNDTYIIDGYKAAYGPFTSYYSYQGDRTNDISIKCQGALSCKSMRSIVLSAKKQIEILCGGFESCSQTSITSISAFIRCYGSMSCTYSTITSTDISVLQCVAYQSCSYSRIESIETIEAYGVYSLYNATIDSNNSTTDVTIQLNGESAAYGATLICREGHICNIYCNARNSCNMFYIDCRGTCNVYKASIDTIAPITNISHLNLHSIIAFNNEELCNTQPTALTFDDKTTEYNDILMLSGNEGPICCRAYNACHNVNIKYESEGTNSVICSASLSCSLSEIYVNNGTVFCEAHSSCWNSHIYEAQAVYCLSYRSCLDTIISAANLVICSAKHSCRDAIIESAGIDVDIYFTGYQSGHSATLNCTETDICNVYCSGADSCSSVSVYCYGFCNIECDTMSGCPLIHYPNSTPITTTISDKLPSNNITTTGVVTIATAPLSNHPSSYSSTFAPILRALYSTFSSNTRYQDTTKSPVKNVAFLSVVLIVLSVLIGILLFIIIVISVMTKNMAKKKARNAVQQIKVNKQYENNVNKNKNVKNSSMVIEDVMNHDVGNMRLAVEGESRNENNAKSAGIRMVNVTKGQRTDAGTLGADINNPNIGEDEFVVSCS